jgi:branched-chain amino acid transport system ATP-binding protein
MEVARAVATDLVLLLMGQHWAECETDLMAKSIKRLRGGRFGRLHSEGPAMIIVEHSFNG